MSFAPGQIVGDYEIISVLGAGGMGKVYKAQHTISERIEAVKELLPDLTANEEAASRFAKEIRVQASLEHPNIAQLRTAFRAENQLLMVMEFVDGHPLDTYLENGQPIPTQHAAWFAIQVLSALEYAHGRNIVHRDIKPSNMMLTERGIIKLLDFGIARVGTDINLTQTRTTAGSLYYMSPEQIKGEATDARVDLYALGISLYQMVTGRRPYTGDNEYALMAAHMHQAPVPPMQLNPSIGQYLNDIILTAIAKDASARFQTAANFKQTLEAYYRQQNFSHQQPQFTSSGQIKTPTPNGPFPAANPLPTLQTGARQVHNASGTMPANISGSMAANASGSMAANASGSMSANASGSMSAQAMHQSGQIPATSSNTGAFVGLGLGLVVLVAVMAGAAYYFLKVRTNPTEASSPAVSTTAPTKPVAEKPPVPTPTGAGTATSATPATSATNTTDATKPSTTAPALPTTTAGTKPTAATPQTAPTQQTPSQPTPAQQAATQQSPPPAPTGGKPATTPQQAESAAAPAPTQPPAATPQQTGAPSMRDIRRDRDSLLAKLGACQSNFENLKKSQEARGMRPNAKFQSDLQFAQSQLAAVDEALRRNAAVEAKESLDSARQVIQRLERDLGN